MKPLENIPQEEFETIERFLTGTMSPEEEGHFQQQLRENTALSEKVEEVKELLQGVETAIFKEKMNVFHEKIPSSDQQRIQKNNPILKTFYRIAAVLVVLFGLFWYLKPTHSNEKLFSTYFTPDPGLPTTMGSGEQFRFYDGMVNYKMKEYDQALQKWEVLLPEKPNNDTINYFMGVAHLAKGNSKKAIPFLEKVLTHKESIFLGDSYFYLGLSNLKNGSMDLAKENLKKSSHPEAVKILQELDK